MGGMQAAMMARPRSEIVQLARGVMLYKMSFLFPNSWTLVNSRIGQMTTKTPRHMTPRRDILVRSGTLRFQMIGKGRRTQIKSVKAIRPSYLSVYDADQKLWGSYQSRGTPPQ